MANRLLHIGTAFLLVVLLALLTDPFMLWMPAQAQMMALLGAAVCASLWAGFILYERTHDEREMAHNMQAGRIAYLSGIVVLTIALVSQGLSHDIDPWIPAVLAVMVVMKLVVRLYAERYA